MDVAEFDRFAEEYLETHARNIAVSGESPEYFARYKIDEIRRVWARRGRPSPRTILDFGSGIGNSVPHFRRSFPDADIIALDVSDKSLAIAERRFAGMARYELYAGGGPVAPDGAVDLAFSACVFHHIDAGEHVELLRRLRQCLSPSGALVIFEHNPINPVTQHIVATCEFDEHAVLIPAGVLKRRLRDAGFAKVEIAYTGFFPGRLARLRPLEPYMKRLPIGAQYYVLGHA
ncbi:MAG TPA: class I SAM-dependent methyltransferase [Caulobacteraceae bacterium]|nr:class I SAM-dependent methyltransferase [Caulobacteraceae bacterium]